MMRADGAEVTWDAEKKVWRVRIRVGEEVIKRPAPRASPDADDEALRSMAVATAADEGYQVDPASVTIQR